MRRSSIETKWRNSGEPKQPNEPTKVEKLSQSPMHLSKTTNATYGPEWKSVKCTSLNGVQIPSMKEVLDDNIRMKYKVINSTVTLENFPTLNVCIVHVLFTQKIAVFRTDSQSAKVSTVSLSPHMSEEVPDLLGIINPVSANRQEWQ